MHMRKFRLPISVSKQIVLLVTGLWLGGALMSIAAFFGTLHSWLSVVLLIPISCFLLLTITQLKALSHTTRLEKGLLLFLVIVWFSHLLQCFTPETGFDAVWYHLPIIKLMLVNHGLIYSPELYQSVNPLYSDMLLLLGFQTVGEVGAKLISYLLAVTLILVAYGLARLFLNRTWSLLFAIAVSLMQVVAWQAASAYIDVAKALWELSSLYVLLVTYIQNKRRQISSRQFVAQLLLSALFFSASLASKHFSIVLIPVMLLIIWYLFHQWKYIGIYLLVSLLVLIPFNWRSYALTGDPFYSMTYHLRTFSTFGNYTTPLQQLLQRTIRLPLSLVQIAIVRDYISPLLVLTIPLLIWIAVKVKKLDITVKVLAIFAASQWLVWWIIPPASTRYALSGFIVVLLLITNMLAEFSAKSTARKKWIIGFYVCVLLISFLPRLYVNQRSWQYLTKKQSKEQYLQQFYDGSIDEKLNRWHGL